jgi:SAM-dependent methyltransferase
MPIYDEFAGLYAQGRYPRYSRRMSDLLPAILVRIGARPKTVLDLACGEGTFAVAMAGRGMDVTGLDASPRMLALARQRARETGTRVRLLEGDMRSLGFEAEFDLVTCWYDSLNYLLSPGELAQTFQGIARALIPGGWLIFDMNTIFGLAVAWRSHPVFVMQDEPDLLDLHVNSYDFERNLATKRVVGFARRDGAWVRIEEIHQERGYGLDDIRTCLAGSTLKEIACWGSFEDMTAPGPETCRVWFVAKKED